MEQRDFLMREIERMSLVLRAIRQKIFGGHDGLEVSFDQQVEDAKGMLWNDLNFDLNKFILLEKEESRKYLSSFEGFNAENMEQLAESIAQIGFSNHDEKSSQYLTKALELYDLINLKSKTFSFEREGKILKIRNTL